MQHEFSEWFNIDDYKKHLTRNMNEVYLLYNFKKGNLLVYINGVKIDEIENVPISGSDMTKKSTFIIPSVVFKYLSNAEYN